MSDTTTAAPTPAANAPTPAAKPHRATLATMLASPKGLWRFLRDPAAPRSSKALAVLTLAYVVSPIDAIPDWLVPMLGWLDDVGVTAAALAYVASQAARYANENANIAVRPASTDPAAKASTP